MPIAVSPATRTACAIVVAAALLSACATPAPDTASADGASDASSALAPAARPDVASAAPASSPAAGTSASATRRSMPPEASVFFEFDSSALSDEGRRVVAQHGDYLAGERRAIRLEGNADERGSREYNLALGQRRADAVRQMLVLRGLAADSVEAVSNGEERPRCGEHIEECYVANRRVDFVYAR